METRSWDYRGRWALVTGASAGIGEAFARALAARGANLVLVARREDRLRALAEELALEHRVHAHAVPADLASAGAVDGLWRRASDARRIELVVNNAGFGLKGEFHALDLERQAAMVQVNCVAAMALAHHAVREMRAAGGGALINVASVAGYQPLPFQAVYSASKAFLITLSEAIAEESRGSGVRVVTLNPGPVATEFQAVAGTAVSDRTFGIRSAEEVVAAALARLEAGGGTATPGLSNRLSAYLVRVAPRSLVVRAAKVVIQRFR